MNKFKEYLEAVKRKKIKSSGRSFSSEFKDFKMMPEVSLFLKKEGFKDTSWHSDEMPSFEKQFDNGNYLRLWVTDGSQRWKKQDFKRFQLVSGKGDFDDRDTNDEEILKDTNNFGEVKDAYEDFNDRQQ